VRRIERKDNKFLLAILVTSLLSLVKYSNYNAKAFVNSHSFNTLEIKHFLQRIFSMKEVKWKINDHLFEFCPRIELAQRSKTFAVFKENNLILEDLIPNFISAKAVG